MDLYTLTNRNGLVAKITNLGGHLPLLGSIVGRYANRIAKGAGPARGCLGRLISVTTNGALRPDVDPVQPRWAGVPRSRAFDPMDLRRDQREYLNVLCLADRSSLITPTRSPGRWSSRHPLAVRR